jgi:two-component system, OmpR family, response regulator
VRLLLIEDEGELARVLRQALEEEGFQVDSAADGEEGLFKAGEVGYDAILLDLMLPGVDGFEVLKHLRAPGGRPVPVLVLTARDGVPDRVRGLNLGADDYLVKPFDLEEMLARVRALIRRSADRPSPQLRVGDVTIDTVARTVRKGEASVELPAKEYALLEYLALHAGEVVTRTRIYEHIYGEKEDTFSNVVEVYVANLRRRLGADVIETRRGHGYLVRA